MAKIFISYRRDDSAGHAGRLYDRLSDHFGPDQVFMDLDTIKPGQDFVDAVRQAVSGCNGLVTIIGGHAHSLRAQQTPSRDSPQQIMIRVDGASCPFCAFGLEKRLGRIEGVADVKLEMKAGKVIVTLEKGATVSEQALRQAVDEAGFTPREITFPQSG